jgi:predicted SprT family Zn-dependent metalloprotease
MESESVAEGNLPSMTTTKAPERVDLDPMFEPWVWHLSEIKDLLSDRHTFRHMNRSESRIYNMAQSILTEKRWSKMKASVDIGVPNPRDPDLRVVKVKHLRGAVAMASDYLYVDKSHLKTRTAKRLKHTIRHELVHFYLSDNQVSKGTRGKDYTDHGKLFKECCAALGLKDPFSYETDWGWTHRCPCGWYLKSMNRRTRIVCSSCHKTMILPTEYRRLKKIAEIGSKLMPVNIDNYVIMKVVKS